MNLTEDRAMPTRKLDIPDETEQELFREMVKEVTKRLRPDLLQPAVDEVPKVGRNEPCPCGSGRKYKHCHGRSAT